METQRFEMNGPAWDHGREGFTELQIEQQRWRRGGIGSGGDELANRAVGGGFSWSGRVRRWVLGCAAGRFDGSEEERHGLGVVAFRAAEGNRAARVAGNDDENPSEPPDGEERMKETTRHVG
jgi:hypothetical protein